MAETYDVALTLHCPLGPVARAACLRVAAASHNALIREQSLGIQDNAGNALLGDLTGPQVFEEADGPGLGIRVN
ncbi:hypothetical protein DEIPH_ctg040orf0040 [Deinococcus phoenicis]|uniref:Enolase C-terminal domain-containing protein n=1 Tax=Deinococcus phoenicis TaxID=1476583 RepID=A0A016QMV7_9DEIO|nr:enolase C-terminal domain-like protein [Deinococcus phoenicis]EYB67475.1 hypothetical protein DEIPH_ctg040orf0040 [Deinococcus phoenicis]